MCRPRVLNAVGVAEAYGDRNGVSACWLEYWIMEIFFWYDAYVVFDFDDSEVLVYVFIAYEPGVAELLITKANFRNVWLSRREKQSARKRRRSPTVKQPDGEKKQKKKKLCVGMLSWVNWRAQRSRSFSNG